MIKTVTVTPTISTSIHAAGDVVAFMEFQLSATAPAGVNPANGFLRVAVLSDDDNEGAALNIHVFREEPTAIAANAAFAPSFADLKKRIGVIAVATGDYSTINSNKQAIKNGLEMEFDAPEGKLWVFIECTGTPTYAATTDLSLALTVLIND